MMVVKAVMVVVVVVALSGVEAFKPGSECSKMRGTTR